jgi:plastocyanin
VPESLRRLAVVLSVAPIVLLAACGDDAPVDATPEPARTIEIRASEYAFNGDPGVISAGDTIEFALVNVGEIDHSLEVLSAEGRSLGRTERIGAGERTAVTVTFDQGGVYRLICDVDDHLSRGQSATITVS